MPATVIKLEDWVVYDSFVSHNGRPWEQTGSGLTEADKRAVERRTAKYHPSLLRKVQFRFVRRARKWSA